VIRREAVVIGVAVGRGTGDRARVAVFVMCCREASIGQRAVAAFWVAGIAQGVRVVAVGAATRNRENAVVVLVAPAAFACIVAGVLAAIGRRNAPRHGLVAAIGRRASGLRRRDTTSRVGAWIARQATLGAVAEHVVVALGIERARRRICTDVRDRVGPDITRIGRRVRRAARDDQYRDTSEQKREPQE